jgi:hypothetical protein
MKYAWLNTCWLALISAFVSTSCVPQVYLDKDFAKHLTTAEKEELAAGKTVSKTHSSYWVMHPQQLYWEGPLRVQPLPNGKFKFTQFGNWKQYDSTGGLLCESNYVPTSAGSAGHSRMYYPAGHLQAVADSWLAKVDGDSVVVARIVQFRGGNESDTSYVEKRWFKNGKFLRPPTRSLDLQGLRPISKH